MGRFSCYAVYKGYDSKTGEEVHRKIFEDWNSAKPYVVSYDDARYKGFNSESDALDWFDKLDEKEDKGYNGKTNVKHDVPNQSLNKSEVDIEFEKACKANNIKPSDVLTMLKLGYIIATKAPIGEE